MIEVRANGFVLDVKTGEKIKYLKQVADIADVTTVNASTTMGFKLPKSPNNINAMEFLGIPGDGSQVPYQKIVAQLLENGVPFIKNGWLNVGNTDDHYNVNISDGIVDFFKAIEGKKLGVDVDLSELNHVKTVQTVIDSFDNEYYTYLVNHYGGKTVLLDEFLFPFNIDYLVPSARVKYLWDKIHSTFGFTYSGTIFENEDFVNAWLTYPKTNSELIKTQAIKLEMDSLPEPRLWVQNIGEYELLPRFNNIPWTSVEFPNPGFAIISPNPKRIDKIIIQETNNYQFTIDFNATGIYEMYHNGMPTTLSVEMPLKIKMFKNGSVVQQIIGGTGELFLPQSAESGDVYTFGIYSLTAREFWQYYNNPDQPLDPNSWQPDLTPTTNFNFLNINLDQVEYAESDFNNTFRDFDIKSFVKEVYWRFGLTPIIDTEASHITYYTVDELLDESRGVIDWSDKYVSRKNEGYTIGNYAQRNYFRHKYNTDESTFNDGVIEVNNRNLKDEETLLTSKTYSPNELPQKMPYSFAQLMTVFPTLIWEGEVKINTFGQSEISYKGLTGRYYWLKRERNTLSALFTSEQLGDTQEANGFNVASTLGTTFRDTTPKYHQGHTRLLNDIKVHEIELALSVVDIINLDFTKLHYFAQEASYYKLNKVTWEEDKNATGEFIRVKRPL